MDQRRFRLANVLAAILAAYLVAIGATLHWHWLQGPPHTQATFALMTSFGLCTALLGLSSVSIALATLHWTRRVSGLIAGLALLAFFWTPHFDWNQFLIWQMLVIYAVQTGFLVVSLGIASAFGIKLVGNLADGPANQPARPSHALQLSITDFSILAGALALLFAAIRGSRPVDLGTTVYLIDAAGGGCAAVVALTVLWACFGSAPIALRVVALALVAPSGGAVHVAAARYAPLLFNWPWYSGVTSAQVIFMVIPCLVLRSRGFRFTWTGR
jgi:hypothetical protein